MGKNRNNRLLILGNGFDLACGQATRIQDFINKQLYINYRMHFDSSPVRLNFLCFLYSLCMNEAGNEWKQFFKIDSAEDWKDFELLLNHIVLDGEIFDRLNTLYKTRFLKNKDNKMPCTLDDIITAYFTSPFAFSNNNLPSEFIDYLENQVETFENNFRKYLSEIDEKELLYVKKKLLYDKIIGESNTVTMTFNYTSIGYIDNCNTDVYPIHGTIGAQNTIIGIDPTTNLQFKECNNIYETLGNRIKFTKTYKRLKNVYYGRELILRDNLNVVTFYGHSLGEQDYSYFQSIFDHYFLYDSKLILEFCYSEFEKENPHAEYDRLMLRITKLINKYGESLENKEHGKNLLTKLMLEGRIIVKQIETEELFTPENINRQSQKYYNCDLVSMSETTKQ